MLDCGASDSFIDQEFVKKNNIKTKKLANPAVIRNADGTANNAGRVTEKVETRMRYKGHVEVMIFYVTNLGNVDVILGLTWLKKHNPEIGWKTGEVVMSRCPKAVPRTMRDRGGSGTYKTSRTQESWTQRKTIEEVEEVLQSTSWA